jgi:hypothetical protein
VLLATFIGESGIVRIIAPLSGAENEELPTTLFAFTCA